MRHAVPFFKNSPDSTRCVLACTKMVLAMLEPHNADEYTWGVLDKIAGKKQGMGVWHFGALTYLARVAQQYGSHVVVVEQFPYKAFRFFPRLTCLYFYGYSAGLWQILFSSLRTEARTIQSFLNAFPKYTDAPEKNLSQKSSLRLVSTRLNQTVCSRFFSGATTETVRISHTPTLLDLCAFLDSGYVCMVQLNGYLLDGERGYGGHMVLVVGYTTSHIIIHNPRLPGSAYRHYSCEVFTSSWESPHAGCRNVYAVKLK
jgi:hypothetical protein